MRETALKKWLVSNNYLMDNTDETKPTHLFLDGGRALIPSDKIEEFYNVYSSCVKTSDLFVVELRTDIYRFFADIDIFSDKQIEYTILDIVRHIQSVITDLYEEDKQVIICDAPEKKVDKNGKQYTKTGYHLYWPEIYIDRRNSLLIRNKFLDRLRLIYGERPEYNTWADVLDECVYKANGIRINGSNKMTRTKVDGTKKTDFKVERRSYNIMSVLNGQNLNNEETIRLKMSMRKGLEKTSIRSDKTEITPISNQELLNRDNDISECELCEEGQQDPSLKRINKNNKKFQEITRFFSIHAPIAYKQSIIKSILHMEDGDVYVIKTNSNYCQNIERSHNSCGIYFVLSKNGIVQKCYCRCPKLEGRLYGYCKDYSSESTPCSLHIKKLLGWDNTKKNPKRSKDKDRMEQILCRKATNYKSQVEMFRANIYNNLILNS